MMRSQMKSCRCLGRKILDQFVNGQELGQAGHVETAAGIVERLHDCRVAVAFTA